LLCIKQEEAIIMVKRLNIALGTLIKYNYGRSITKLAEKICKNIKNRNKKLDLERNSFMKRVVLWES
jgi:hypothetical protein